MLNNKWIYRHVDVAQEEQEAFFKKSSEFSPYHF